MIVTNFAGLRIVVSEQASECVRIKRYPKRRAKSESHWRRMDKKWAKRYGYRNEPRLYKLGGENVIACHPMLYEQLRREIRAVRSL